MRNKQLHSFVRAESKQAIATLRQVQLKNSKPYLEFPTKKEHISTYLDNFNWNKPWSSGAQYSGLCVFAATQMPKENFLKIKNDLKEYIEKKVNESDGCYYEGSQPNLTELINGTMKVITGLDWLDVPIHYPEKIIDVCLENKPSKSGCDLVDYVYVLYRCSLQTEYRKKDILLFFEKMIDLIFEHFYEDIGGFSYNLNESQKLYYGVKISNGYDQPDLHGTILLTWALSMIFEISEDNKFSWNILKP